MKSLHWCFKDTEKKQESIRKFLRYKWKRLFFEVLAYSSSNLAHAALQVPNIAVTADFFNLFQSFVKIFFGMSCRNAKANSGQ